MVKVISNQISKGTESSTIKQTLLTKQFHNFFVDRCVRVFFLLSSVYISLFLLRVRDRFLRRNLISLHSHCTVSVIAGKFEVMIEN